MRRKSGTLVLPMLDGVVGEADQGKARRHGGTEARRHEGEVAARRRFRGTEVWRGEGFVGTRMSLGEVLEG